MIFYLDNVKVVLFATANVTLFTKSITSFTYSFIHSFTHLEAGDRKCMQLKHGKAPEPIPA